MLPELIPIDDEGSYLMTENEQDRVVPSRSAVLAAGRRAGGGGGGGGGLPSAGRISCCLFEKKDQTCFCFQRPCPRYNLDQVCSSPY